MGFCGRAAASKPCISKCNAKCRKQWCKERCHWTLEQWRRVLWSDESRFSIWQSDRRVWVWWLPRGRYLFDCFVPSVTFSGGGIMVCGCFSGAGLDPLVPVKGTLNALAYQEMLGMTPSCSNMTLHQCTKQVHKDMDERVWCG